MNRIVIFLLTLAIQACVAGVEAMARESNVSKPLTYEVALDNNLFSVASPIAPDSEFSKHQPFISLRDKELFKNPGVGVTALKLNWTYKEGLLFRTVSGVLEMRVLVFASKQSVDTLDKLKRNILDSFKEDHVLVKLGYSGGDVPFEENDINGRTWVTYTVPAVGGRQYATSLSDDRYLIVHFGLVNNTRDQPLEWQEKARALIAQLVASMRLDVSLRSSESA